ncbi:MAG: hypothetical protein Q8N05_06945 [Bacteroidota bacterium]|nr:hypothetical protein [Bacteroidota bacterium]
MDNEIDEKADRQRISFNEVVEKMPKPGKKCRTITKKSAGLDWRCFQQYQNANCIA